MSFFQSVSASNSLLSLQYHYSWPNSKDLFHYYYHLFHSSLSYSNYVICQLNTPCFSLLYLKDHLFCKLLVNNRLICSEVNQFSLSFCSFSTIFLQKKGSYSSSFWLLFNARRFSFSESETFATSIALFLQNLQMWSGFSHLKYFLLSFICKTFKFMRSSSSLQNAFLLPSYCFSVMN